MQPGELDPIRKIINEMSSDICVTSVPPQHFKVHRKTGYDKYILLLFTDSRGSPLRNRYTVLLYIFRLVIYCF
jgi:hypothetical protein